MGTEVSVWLNRHITVRNDLFSVYCEVDDEQNIISYTLLNSSGDVLLSLDESDYRKFAELETLIWAERRNIKLSRKGK